MIRSKLKELFTDFFNGEIFNKKTILLALPFILMDLFIRILSFDVNYRMVIIILPSVLYSVMWIGLITLVSMLLGTRTGRIFYGVSFLLFFVMFLAHSVYYPYSGFFFSFNMLRSAKEGGAYVWNTIANSGIWTFASSIIVLASGVLAIVKFPKSKKIRWKSIIFIFIIFVILQLFTPVLLGVKNDELEWDNWRNPRNVFDSFSDCNKNIKICGLYEYTFRDFYVSFMRPKKKASDTEVTFLEEAYDTTTVHAENDYTGIFEGKNVIFLQLEGIDSWLLNETDMPNLYSMLDNSYVFDNHYSYYNGGGSTFNSELAVVTGFITPVSYVRNPYSFNTNSFPGSLPNMLKDKGYTVNGFHMNTGEYYMRRLNYENWGFDNYFSLIDDSGCDEIECQLDRALIEDELFYEKMFCNEQPFCNYIITYSVHTPFSLDSKMGSLLAEKEFSEDVEIPEMDEQETARFFAGETDYMVGLLLEALRENDLYDNTVIVAFSDHYLYTLNDKSILDEYKITENNLINNTPFFIWSADTERTNVSKVNSQLDILPTVLNMLGVGYYDEYYIGNDIFDSDFSGYVFFCDYSWYDGEFYVELGEAENASEEDEDYILETNEHINNLIRKNDLTLKYNYFAADASEQDSE